MSSKEKKEEQKKILILCVDRDDDLGVKAKIETPLLGREANLNAAVALALADPEEADANAMFEAVRIHDRLQSRNKPDEVFEIATIAGSELGGVSADRKIASEFDELLKSFKADEVILISDGYSDEAVLPLIESRVPVSSVRRIVMRHSESIEETAAIFTRYLKLIIENPRYARIALGLPGLLILLLGILSIFNLLYYYWIAFVFVLSVFMLIKGFGVDKKAQNFYKWIKEYSPPPLQVLISRFSLIAGTLSMIVGLYLGWVNVTVNVTTPQDIAGWIGQFGQISGYFIKGCMDLIIIGVCLTLLGRVIYWYFERNTKLLRNGALIVMAGWFRQILDGTADVLINPEMGYEKLMFAIIVGVLLGIAATLVVIVVQRSYKKFFKKIEGEEFEKG
ncbi:DUF373 family protein [Candidatus Bathyarchaeota archaeon]|nr:MAG: DUF373 family protein [Candidatus Bathyarchaeota archaeon]